MKKASAKREAMAEAMKVSMLPLEEKSQRRPN
jgi:hypothetical protein